MMLPGMVAKSLDAMHRRMLDILKAINGGIELGYHPPAASIGFDSPVDAGNLNATIVGVSFASVGVDTVVTHNLGRIPSGFILIAKGQTMDVYNGSNPVVDWNTSTMTLRATATGTMKVLIF